MSFLRTKRNFASYLRSPTFAVIAAFALRIILLWLSHYREDRSHPRLETVGLEEKLIAFSLAQGHGFAHPYPGYDTVTACLAPVYPFLWAIGIRLLGLGSFGATLFAQAMNSAFSATTCWPIYAIGKKVFGEKIGLASAWLWVFLPYAVLMPIEWTWDQSLSALLLALIVSGTLSLGETASSLAWTGYGLLWALAALTNPALCLLLPFFLGWLMVRSRVSGALAVSLAGRAAIVFLLALAPWTIRNYYALDGWVFVKSNFGMELWLGNNPALKEVYTPQFHPASNFSERILLIMSGEPNYNRAKERQALAYIRQHPRAFVKNVSDRIADTWTASYDSRVEPWIVALGLGRANVWFCAAFSILSFAGLALALRGSPFTASAHGEPRTFSGNGGRANPADSLLLAICLVVFPVSYYITHTALRYRHPIDPFLAIFSVYAIAGSRLRVWFARPTGQESSDGRPLIDSRRDGRNHGDIPAHQV